MITERRHRRPVSNASTGLQFLVQLLAVSSVIGALAGNYTAFALHCNKRHPWQDFPLANLTAGRALVLARRDRAGRASSSGAAPSRFTLDPPLIAKDERKLKVLAICRISTLKQDERSLADQEALYRHWLEEHTDLPYDMTVIASQGSGENLDREAYLKAIELVESGEFDLVISEDLGRVCRRVHAHLFCENCEDHGTRLIALNDHVDTGRDDWRLSSFFAVMRHETYNRDTAQRIRRSLRNRFMQGAIFQFTIFGYIKPPGAKSDDQVTKDLNAQPLYEEWFRRLDNGALYAEVADWLNEQGIPPGPHCRSKKWTGKMVARITHNPILKGIRVRNNKMSRRVNKTGRRRSVNAPPHERLERHCPHLAFFEPSYYDRVVRKADVRNAKYRRAGKNGTDPLQNVPKKRSRFPGQSIFCGRCGRLFVFGGHGQKDHLMCSGARGHVCWNGITVDGPTAARKISEAVFAEIEALAEFDAAFLVLVNEEAKKLDGVRDGRLRELVAEVSRTDREIANVVKFIRSGDDSQRVRVELQGLEEKLRQLQYDKDQLELVSTGAVVVPAVAEIKQLAREAFRDLSLDSFEFAKLLRGLTGKIIVDPYRLCDGGHIILRARFRLQIANLLPDARLQEVVRKPLEIALTVDLMEKPPQRVEFREAVMARRAAGETERQIAKALGITQTAVQRAAALDRLMKRLGLTDPYVRLMEPPADYSKLRRHLHPRYRFESLPDHDPG